MNERDCSVCGERLPEWSRADRRTCSVRCRVARQRRSKRANPVVAALGARATVGDQSTGVTAVTSRSARSDDQMRPVVTAAATVLLLSSWLADVSAEATTQATAKARTS
jgi:hypothetical protein